MIFVFFSELQNELPEISHALSLPCRWDGDVILVDDIRISKPYTPQQCRGGTPQSLPRVQKIVRHLRDCCLRAVDPPSQLEAARKKAEGGKK